MRRLRRRDLLREGLSVDVLHRDVGDAVRDPGVEDGADRVVAEVRGDGCLAPEPLEELVRARPEAADELQGDDAVEAGVLREVDDRLAAASDLADELIGADRGRRGVRRARGGGGRVVLHEAVRKFLRDFEERLDVLEQRGVACALVGEQLLARGRRKLDRALEQVGGAVCFRAVRHRIDYTRGAWSAAYDDRRGRVRRRDDHAPPQGGRRRRSARERRAARPDLRRPQAARADPGRARVAGSQLPTDGARSRGVPAAARSMRRPTAGSTSCTTMSASARRERRRR